MAWATPTITQLHGRYVTLTKVTAVCVLEDAAFLSLHLHQEMSMPICIFGGGWCPVGGGGVNGTQTFIIRVGFHTIGNHSNSNTAHQQITPGAGADPGLPQSIFEQLPTGAGIVSDIVLPVNELTLIASGAATDTATVTVYLSLLSHRMEV
ncbi:MAG TPA: hypothetical protein VM118_14315 [Acidobacteriota bacterium]|nr:hypothetical protein [Acidobacteriota bacterium]